MSGHLEMLVSRAAELPLWQQVLGGFVVANVVLVTLNVLWQLLVPRNRSLPPLVFHYYPVVGSAVTYGGVLSVLGGARTALPLGRKVSMMRCCMSRSHL